MVLVVKALLAALAMFSAALIADIRCAPLLASARISHRNAGIVLYLSHASTLSFFRGRMRYP